jgi:hypothetical protein
LRARSLTPPKRAGFQTDGGASSSSSRVEKRAEALLRAASSLLLYQQALAGDIPQAFLKVLAALRLGRDGGMPALQAYGAFFSKLAADGRAWPDVLLDAVIGCESAFAVKAARGGGAPPAALRAAAGADLEALQQLCVCETTLAEWVQNAVDVASDADTRDAWLAASASVGAADDREGGGGADGRHAARLRASDELADALAGADDAAEADVTAVGPPLSVAAARAARDALRLRPRWRDGARDLEALHRAFGAGAAATASVLTWRDGALAPAPDWLAAAPTAAAAAHADAAALAAHKRTLLPLPLPNLGAARGSSLLLHGAAASATAAALLACAPAARTVALGRGDVKALGALCDVARAQPRTHYIFLLDALALVPFGEGYLELVAVLRSPHALPPNATILATSLDDSALRFGEGAADAALHGPLGGLWGARVACEAPPRA